LGGGGGGEGGEKLFLKKFFFVAWLATFSFYTVGKSTFSCLFHLAEQRSFWHKGDLPHGTKA